MTARVLGRRPPRRLRYCVAKRVQRTRTRSHFVNSVLKGRTMILARTRYSLSLQFTCGDVPTRWWNADRDGRVLTKLLEPKPPRPRDRCGARPSGADAWPGASEHSVRVRGGSCAILAWVSWSSVTSLYARNSGPAPAKADDARPGLAGVSGRRDRPALLVRCCGRTSRWRSESQQPRSQFPWRYLG